MAGTLLTILALTVQPVTACAAYVPRPIIIPADAPWRTPEGAVRVVGYNDMAEMLLSIGTAFSVRQPGITFSFVLKGTRTGPPALLDGTSAFAPMGAEFAASDLVAWRARYKSDPVEFRIAKDSLDPKALSSPLGIFVNAQNPLAHMAMTQLRLALTKPGLIWSDLGLRGEWARHPVHVMGLSPDLALALWMRRHALGGKALTRDLRGFAKSRQVVGAVGQDPLAIGFADLSHADDHVHAIALAQHPKDPWHSGDSADLQSGRYPLERQLLIYAQRDDVSDVTGAFVDFVLSCEGQQIIAAGSLGYLPLDAGQLAKERKNLRFLTRQVRDR